MEDITLKINEIAIEYYSGNNSKFAKAMNTSEANIRNYRNGTIPKIDFIIKLSEKLKISLDWLLLNKGNKNKLNYENVDLYERLNDLEKKVEFLQIK
ncbi:helix-turn-helix transcriptional regulator [Flavobacterium sp. LS1R49]|uniref:Helix-turn-helix transcriptional regulator n=1 Tax=Flavobacterium shii TaxID=2987687 RepID=A0A9X2ZCU6_9FLAO|nr:helix-turn-helix transcriptional regulator [Flavobacterium shii]MCV9928220.1 helix-turn-helix transcriptional regulator [Flavobacterium shii]